MIKDKERRWTDAQIKELIGKIQGYKKAPQKSRKPPIPKALIKPIGKSKRRIILEHEDRVVKKSKPRVKKAPKPRTKKAPKPRKEMTMEEKAARVAKMQAGLAAWKQLTPQERHELALRKKEDKEHAAWVRKIQKKRKENPNFV